MRVKTKTSYLQIKGQRAFRVILNFLTKLSTFASISLLKTCECAQAVNFSVRPAS